METKVHPLQPASAGAPNLDTKDPSVFVNSSRFIAQLAQAQTLKGFLFKEKVALTEEQLKNIDLSDLNNLVYKEDGRNPSSGEWHALDEKHAALISCLDLQLRRKLRVSELEFFFGFLPMVSLAVCAVSTIVYLVYSKLIDPNGTLGILMFVTLLIVWTISQGTLGACAFLGTSVLSTRTVEITSPKAGETKPPPTEEIDITDPSVLQIRILSGALFAFLIGLPFSYQALDVITDSLFTPAADSKINLAKIGLIFIPFIIGFSTNFVLTLLNRIIASLQILLGVTSRLQ